jgi:hypothetical protein
MLASLEKAIGRNREGTEAAADAARTLLKIGNLLQR